MTKFSSGKKTVKNSPSKTVGQLLLSGKKKAVPVKLAESGFFEPSDAAAAAFLAYSKAAERSLGTQFVEMHQKDLSKESTVADAGAEESEAARLKARHAMLLSLIGQDELRHRLEGLFPNILSKRVGR